MSRFLVEHAGVVTESGILQDACVVIENGKIVTVAESAAIDRSTSEVIDAGGAYLAPGYIDLHVHGAGDYLIDKGPDDLAGLCRLLPRFGVTSFLPTVCPRVKGEDSRFVSSLSKVQSEGTAILGFHLEGPFLSITGALPPEAIGDADPDRVRDLMQAAAPYRAVFSISPDFEGITDLIGIMAADGAPVFITHTGADVEQTKSAIEAGARHATHFYNVFYAPEESDGGVRPAGAVEAILADQRVTVDFILDGEHVDPVVVGMALSAKGSAGVCLITDGQIGAGNEPGRYMFGEQEVEIAYRGGPARMTKKGRFKKGGLAGSGLTMDLAVRNAVKMLGVDVAQATRMASTNPARVLGVDNIKGKIQEGYDADMVLLDKDLFVMQTWVAGEPKLDRQ